MTAQSYQAPHTQGLCVVSQGVSGQLAGIFHSSCLHGLQAVQHGAEAWLREWAEPFYLIELCFLCLIMRNQPAGKVSGAQ